MNLDGLSRVESSLRFLVKMSGAEIARAQPPDSDPYASSEEGDEMDTSPEDLSDEEDDDDEDSDSISRRAVRRLDFPPRGRKRRRLNVLDLQHPYPEESRHLEIGHRGASIGMPMTDCNCPEVLTKGTLVAIVAALAFLSFFSTCVLLVVVVCLLRLVEKQRKTGKEATAGYSPPKRPDPPVPPPRPDHTYLAVKPVPGYERLHPASPTTPESEYITVNPLSAFSTPPLEKNYSNADAPPLEKTYVNAGEPQLEPLTEDSPNTEMAAKGHEDHIYEEVE
ncbi:uncharacterized protein LOC133373759 isoform X4 [Rhineura floridana]|uniref:uncharacterized protein LOC133373759 isoform X4 n=1 Tax=Rhineura floridana TaxID=261503 RepID=UPI002AC85318|nr:uncharacterized protein LOC133373759 isoform X4 [Rhineura floridana]